jgi:hypothetical protein
MSERDSLTNEDGTKNYLPNVQGQNFPEHEHREFPKMLFAGGDKTAEARTVGNAEEEAAARDEGFADATTQDEGGDPTTGAAEGDDTISGGADDDAPKATRRRGRGQAAAEPDPAPEGEAEAEPDPPVGDEPATGAAEGPAEG